MCLISQVATFHQIHELMPRFEDLITIKLVFPDLITDGPRRANQVEKQKEK